MESRRKILVRHRSGESIRSISKCLNIDRKTVRKIINSDVQEVVYKRKVQPHRALGDYIEPLEKLLRDNQSARPKGTIKHLYEVLQRQGYTGSYSAVTRYASGWSERNKSAKTNACVPLYFSPGEAYQFDWSSDIIEVSGVKTKVKVAHFVLCYSRKRFCYIYPNETQEMLFDAHVRAFDFFGGTPIRGIYDNMKTAVTKVLRGKEREWNPSFERLCSHYRIEPAACSPARGNEKGRVERQVRLFREEFFTPMPKGNSLSEINEALMSRLVSYNNSHKHPEYKDKTIDEIFEDERKYLVSAPIMFDGCKEVDLKVSNTCLVRYDHNDYSVHCSNAGRIITCKAYASQLIFIANDIEVGRHERRFTSGRTYYDWQHYVPILSRKPGALKNGAPFIEMYLPEDLDIVRRHLEPQNHGIKDFAMILSYIHSESMESVLEACKQAVKSKTINRSVIENLLFRFNNNDEEPNKEHAVDFNIKQVPIADCNRYDQLLSGASA